MINKLFVILLILLAIDVASTIYILNLGGIELNPFPRYLIKNYGYIAWVASYLAWFGLLYWITNKLYTKFPHRKRFVYVLLIFPFLMLSIVVVNNTYQMIRCGI